jgi:hypothetical protein
MPMREREYAGMRSKQKIKSSERKRPLKKTGIDKKKKEANRVDYIEEKSKIVLFSF